MNRYRLAFGFPYVVFKMAVIGCSDWLVCGFIHIIITACIKVIPILEVTGNVVVFLSKKLWHQDNYPCTHNTAINPILGKYLMTRNAVKK